MRDIWLSLLALSCAHRPVESGAFPAGNALGPPATGVEIGALRDPPGAEELGVAEAHGTDPATLVEVVAAFRDRVAEMGGDYGRLDDIASKIAVVQETSSYECGSNQTRTETELVTRANPDGTFSTVPETVTVTTYVSQTCWETREVEHVTWSVVGRALRTTREGK